MSWIFLDGSFLPEAEAKLPITDRAFLFGDGVFTTARVCEGQIEFLQQHIERLLQNCHELNIEPPVIKVSWLQELIERNTAKQGIWRLKIIITGGTSVKLGLPKRSGSFFFRIAPYSPPATPAHLCLFPESIHSAFASVKTLAYLDRLRVYEFAQQQGVDEALVLSSQGYLLESAFSNIFWVNQGAFFIPDRSLPYLKGILLSQLMGCGLKVKPVKATVAEIPEEAHVYLCNALTHVRPVVAIQHRSFTRNVDLEQQLSHFLNKQLGM